MESEMSTVKIIKYQDSGAFTFNPNKVEIDINGARLKKKELTSGELLLATGRKTVEAELGDFLPVYTVGSDAFWSAVEGYNTYDNSPANYFSLNDPADRDGITAIPDTSHFNFDQVGTIRMKVRVPYTGAPTANNAILATGDSLSGAGLGSLISLQHLAGSGNFQIRTYNAAAVATIANFPAWLPVMDQDYEIELNYNGTTVAVNGVPPLTISMFIDGIAHGSGSVRAGSGPRDFFYLGAYYSAGSFSSEAAFRDIQIFNTIQHSSSFTSEIPRIVGLYPEDALIAPLESSVAKGFVSLADDATLPTGSDLKYVLRIESGNFWIDGGGSLVVSDGSFAESTKKEDWNLPVNIAQIDAAIASGARITMLPILSSGPIGLETPDLDSHTLTYIFFAVPETCIGCTLYGWVSDNCKNIISGTINVKTTKPILTQGHLESFDETRDIDASSGFFDVGLIRPNLKVVATSTTPSIPADSDDLILFTAKWTTNEGLDDNGDIITKSHKYVAKLRIPDAASVLLQEAVV